MASTTGRGSLRDGAKSLKATLPDTKIPQRMGWGRKKAKLSNGF
jgi:hypothetical protein